MNNIELRDATRIGDTEYYRVEQALNELFYTVKIVKFC
jgi:hypothetical protein